MKSKAQGAFLLSVVLSVRAAAAGCVEVEGPALRVSSFAAFIEQAPELETDRILASTPDPGTRRWVTPVQLRQWRLSPLASLAPLGVCIERHLHPLQSEDIVQEIAAALRRDDVGVRNVGITSVQPLLVPKGRLNLPLTGLQALSTNGDFCSFIWRGDVEFDNHRQVAIKVLGRYQSDTFQFVAKRSLRSGDALSTEDYQRTARPGCSGGQAESALPEGSTMRRALRPGDVIEISMLKAPPLVDGGAALRVIASAGGALVSVEAVAEKAGTRGEIIFAHVQENGKRIRVLLTGKGEASAIVAGVKR